MVRHEICERICTGIAVTSPFGEQSNSLRVAVLGCEVGVNVCRVVCPSQLMGVLITSFLGACYKPCVRALFRLPPCLDGGMPRAASSRGATRGRRPLARLLLRRSHRRDPRKSTRRATRRVHKNACALHARAQLWTSILWSTIIRWSSLLCNTNGTRLSCKTRGAGRNEEGRGGVGEVCR